jgi:hypothetical protein
MSTSESKDCGVKEDQQFEVEEDLSYPAPSAPTDTFSITKNLEDVLSRMNESILQSNRCIGDVTLVAVSKTKPVEDMMALYHAGHRKFGENYMQELLEKAPVLPKDIEFHFIGHLQSQKASKLVREVPNLSVVETVDSLKLAKKLNTAVESIGRMSLDIYIQVDTSGEDTKSGVNPDEVVDLVTSIKAECPFLNVKGLMTIGAPDDYTCFDKLVAVRQTLANTFAIPPETLALR